MCSKKTKEWNVIAPWGHIAMLSWGNPDNPPMLLIHGYMDTAATFTFIVDKLPDDHYYVGFDMPGHGKSDPLSNGIHMTNTHLLIATRIVVEHMKWNRFKFMSHSVGAVIGLFYNYLYPGTVEKIITLDIKPPLAWYYVIHYYQHMWYKILYGQYYENYEKFNGKPKSQNYEAWIKSVVRARKLTEEQSKVVLSRALIPTRNGLYQLSWESRSKFVAHTAVAMDIFYAIMTTNIPPILIIHSPHYADFVKVPQSKEYAEILLKHCEENIPHFKQVTVVDGGHDFHITNPELAAEHIEKFLKCSSNAKSKL